MFRRVRNELTVPTNLSSNPDARELVRIWSVGEEGQTFVLNPLAWDDPAAWGLLLVDLARHTSRAFAQSHDGWDEAAVLARIKQGFDMEYEHPTD